MTKVSVSVSVIHVEDKDIKYKFVECLYPGKISREEIDSSEVWALTDAKSGDCYWLIMLVHEDLWKNESSKCVRLTHLGVSYEEVETIIWMYSIVEEWCIENGIQDICISIPLGYKGLKKLRSLLKRLGYKRLAILELDLQEKSPVETEGWAIRNIKSFWEEGKGRKIKQNSKKNM